MENQNKPGPSSIASPSKDASAITNNSDLAPHRRRLVPTCQESRTNNQHQHQNQLYDSQGLLKCLMSKSLTSEDKNGSSNETNANSNLTFVLENAKNIDREGSSLPSELHAVCLMALFHVNFVCGICNEALIDCICLECGHNFCTLCIHQWFTYNRVCPTCYQVVKDDFGVQRTYCVDEFIAEMYTSMQELSQEYFGNTNYPKSPDIDVNYPHKLPTVADIQTSLRNPRVLNPTCNAVRQKLKHLRRAYIAERHPSRERDDFSLLEQQTELLGSADISNLSGVVQFFLSSITAYVTYEGSDSINSDWLLVGAISSLVWYLAFISIMRLIGYDGSFGELISQLHFIEFFERDSENEDSNSIRNDNDSSSVNSTDSNDQQSVTNSINTNTSTSVRNNFSTSSGQEIRSHPVVYSSRDFRSSTQAPMEWDTTDDEIPGLGSFHSRLPSSASGSSFSSSA